MFRDNLSHYLSAIRRFFSQHRSVWQEKKWVLVTILALVLISVYLFSYTTSSLKGEKGPTLAERYPGLNENELPSMLVREKAQKAAEMVRVSEPEIGRAIRSPLVVSGQVDRAWSPDTFLIELHANDGTLITTAQAHIDGDKIEGFLPFTATLEFPPQPAGTFGKMVIKNSNPSGPPDNDLSYNFEVSF